MRALDYVEKGGTSRATVSCPDGTVGLGYDKVICEEDQAITFEDNLVMESKMIEGMMKYGGDELRGVVRDDDDNIDSVVKTGEYGVPESPLPSGDSYSQHNQKKAEGGTFDDVKGDTGCAQKCFMENGLCRTHNCEVVKVKQKVKRWAYLDKKKQYGYKHSTAVRLICKSGGGGPESDVKRDIDGLAGGISSLVRQGRESSDRLQLEDNVKQGQNGRI